MGVRCVLPVIRCSHSVVVIAAIGYTAGLLQIFSKRIYLNNSSHQVGNSTESLYFLYEVFVFLLHIFRDMDEKKIALSNSQNKNRKKKKEKRLSCLEIYQASC